MASHPQLKKHRMDGEYPYENGHMTGESQIEFTLISFSEISPREYLFVVLMVGDKV
jgi:hypothetical protein